MPIRNAAPLAVLAAFAIAACGRRTDSHPVTPVGVEPSLWEVSAFDPQGRRQATTLICADDRLQAGFARPVPVVGDQTCGGIQVLEQRADAWSATCRIGDQAFGIDATVGGDRTRDFKVEISVKQMPAGPVFQQVRRYRKVAEACPHDWTVGSAGAANRPAPHASRPGEAANPVIDEQVGGLLTPPAPRIHP